MAPTSRTTPPGRAGAARGRGPGRPPAGGEDKRERILVEALGLFALHGYAGTSLADVAQAAEISKPGLLHHFPSKTELFAAVLERRDQQASTEILDGAGDLWEALDRWAALMEDNVAHPEGTALYVALSSTAVDAAHPAHDWLIGHLDGAIDFLRSAVERGQERGTVRADAPAELIARTIVAISDGMQIQWAASRTGRGGARTVDPVAETLLVRHLLEDRWRLPAPGDGKGEDA